MAWYAAREGELPEQPCHAGRVPPNLRIDLFIAAIEPRAGQHGGTAMPRPADEQNLAIIASNDPVEMRMDEGEPRRGSPMSQQARLDIFGCQWPTQQWIVGEVDLPDGEVIRRAPPSVDRGQLMVGKCDLRWRQERCSHANIGLLLRQPVGREKTAPGPCDTGCAVRNPDKCCGRVR